MAGNVESFPAAESARMPLRWKIDERLKFIAVVATGSVERSELDVLLDAMRDADAFGCRRPEVFVNDDWRRSSSVEIVSYGRPRLVSRLWDDRSKRLCTA